MNVTKTFLHVDDDRHDAEFVEAELKQLPFNINLRSVRDGIFARDYMEGRGEFADRGRNPLPDVIILDLKMPRSDGFEFLGWLRTQAPSAQRLIPVVVMSSSAIPDDVQRAYASGANSYLVKPVNFSEFHNCVNKLATYWATNIRTSETQAPGPV